MLSGSTTLAIPARVVAVLCRAGLLASRVVMPANTVQSSPHARLITQCQTGALINTRFESLYNTQDPLAPLSTRCIQAEKLPASHDYVNGHNF